MNLHLVKNHEMQKLLLYAFCSLCGGLAGSIKKNS